MAHDDPPTADEVAQLRARVAELETQLAERQRTGLPLLETAIPSLVWDLDFRVLEWNDAAEELFGYTRAEAIGRHGIELIVPGAIQPEVEKIVLELKRNRGVYAVNDNVTKDGRIITCQWFNTPLRNSAGEITCVASLAYDITEQKRTERELLASEERWRTLVENAPEIIITTDREGRVQFINRVEEGYDAAQVVGCELCDFCIDEHREMVQEVIARIVATGEPQWYEVRDRLNGAWFSAMAGPIFSGSEVAGVMVLCQETTERKQDEEALRQSRDALSVRVAERTRELDRLVAQLRDDIAVREKLERELRQSEERFRAIVTSVPVPLAITRISDGRILYVNHHLASMVALEPDAMVGTSALDYYLNPGDRQHILEKLGQDGQVSDYEMHMKRPNGESLWALFSVRPMTYEGEEAMVSTFLDITERHRAEQLLRHERRLLQRLLELQERDRQLIAYEIHDGFVQDVVGGKMLLEAIVARLQAEPDPRMQELNQALHFLTRAINEGRRMIGELRPMIIDEEGIVAAILYLINSEIERGGPEIQFVDNIQFERLEPILEGTVFRIVQEAVANAIRHAHTESIEVRLTQVDDQLHIEVEDFGVGFDQRGVPEDRFGLRGIQERARLFGGQATIKSVPGEGTRVHAVLPISLPRDKAGV